MNEFEVRKEQQVLINNAMKYYVDMGLPILPLCPHDHKGMSNKHKESCHGPGKISLIKWKNLTEVDETHLAQWHDQFMWKNVGLKLGGVSGYIGVDIDGDEGENIFLSMANGGEIPETWEFSTGAGRRLIYSIPAGLRTKKKYTSGEGTHEECAILCEGQYTVMPPSIHKSGRTYDWHPEKNPQVMDCAMAPKWMIDLIREDDRRNLILPLAGGSAAGDNAPVTVSMSDYFVPVVFDASIPDDIATGNIKAVKKSKKATKAEKTSSVDDVLWKVVSEGGRDNALTRIIGHFMAQPAYRAMPQDVFVNFCLGYNNQYMDPPIEADSVKAKAIMFYEQEAQKTAAYKELQKSEKKFNPKEMAQACLNVLKEKENIILHRDMEQGVTYMCKTYAGPWRPVTKGFGEYLEGLVADVLVNPIYGDEKWSDTKRIMETMNAIERELLSRSLDDVSDTSMKLDNTWDQYNDFICVDGKLLNIRTGELLPWDPKFRHTYSFDIGYDPAAECPHWDKYMKDWIPDKASREALQVYLGTTLVPEIRFNHIFYLVGTGANGKSVFLRTIKSIFPSDRISSVTTNRLTKNQFGPSALYNKLVNICEEDEGNERKEIAGFDVLKNISSGGVMQVEFKGQDSFTALNFAKLLFATNHMPKIPNATAPSTYRRFRIIEFPNSFLNSPITRSQMEAQINSDRAGIFNWLLKGLQKSFDYPDDIPATPEMDRTYQQFKEDSDIYVKFTSNCLGYDKELGKAGVSLRLVKPLFKVWYEVTTGKECKMSEITIGKRLREATQAQSGKSTNRKCHTTQEVQNALMENGMEREAKQIKNNNTTILHGFNIEISDFELYESMVEALDGYGAAEQEGIAKFYLDMKRDTWFKHLEE